MVHLYKAQFFFPFAIRTKDGSTHAENHHHRLRQEDGDIWRYGTEIKVADKYTFNTAEYFHPHARRTLFQSPIKKAEGGSPGPKQTGSGGNQSYPSSSDELSRLFGNRPNDSAGEEAPSVSTFEVDPLIVEGGEIAISFMRGKDERTVHLRLTDVSALVYDLGVGVICIGVEWDKLKVEKDEQDKTKDEKYGLTFDDVLDVNNLFRRSSPSFITGDPQGVTEDFAQEQKSKSELATSITMTLRNGKTITEDYGEGFDAFLTQEKGHSLHPQDYQGEHLDHWLKSLCRELDIEKESVVASILDERNFVTCFTIVDDSDSHKNSDRGELKVVRASENPYGALTSENEDFRNRLYQYLYVDPAKNNYTSNCDFRDELLSRALYLRFRDLGSYYGFTRYSGMYLYHHDGKVDWFTRNILAPHFDRLYFYFAALLLSNRAILLELSRRCAETTTRITSVDSLELGDLSRGVENLRCDFLKFHNKYWYCEVTSQEQGIEIYDLWNRQIGNERLFREVEQEVRALHEFSLSTINHSLGKLTYLNLSAVILAILALGLAAVSTNILQSPVGIILLLLACGIGVGVVLSLLSYKKGPEILRKIGEPRRSLYRFSRKKRDSRKG